MLEVSNLGFCYGRWRHSTVFSELSWKVPPGKVTLLLGPNGAGKSTLLKLLAGYEAPGRGVVSFRGDTSRRALFDGVGWMPQSITAVKGLTALEQVQYAAWVAGLSRREAREAAQEALSLVRLADRGSIRASELSGGQLRRLGLAQGLVRRAPVLLLDEPTAGLDPAQAINFRRLLKGLDCPGGIVVSTHQVADLAEDVDHVAVLSQGEMVFDGDVDSFWEHGRSTGSASSLAEIFSRMVNGGLH